MKLTISLVLIAIIVFIVEIFSFPLLGLTTEQFFNNFAFSTDSLLAKPWVVMTSIFLHADLTHLLSNIIVLFFFGAALEEEIGWKKTLLVFMIAAFAGQLTSVVFYSPDTLSLGASAGIFGLIGIGILVAPFSFKFPNPIPLGLMGIAYGFYNIIGFFSGPSEISYIAHFGGLFVGLLFGFHYRGMKRGLGLIVVLSIIFLVLLMTVPLILKWLFG